ncbi:MAG: alkylated DNA repair dioxygenase AlkB [Bermanella sp.]|jgi:alkylated DNA repair dioxygenase AlkB
MSGGDLFNQPTRSIEWLELGASRLGVLNGFIEDHRQLYQQLCDEIDWDQPSVRVYGKSHKVPRLTAFYGDECVEYRYSGLNHRALGWHPTLRTIKDRIDSVLSTRFNTVLLNWYRDGSDTMGFHADDEVSLGKTPLIGSVSLGASRRFVIKPRDNKSKIRREIVLQGGSLLVMAGHFQSEWLHAVPADRALSAGRINLTFRKIVA